MAEKYEEAGTRLEKAAALFAQAEQLAAAVQWDPLYDLLTPYVLGMEEAPGLKGMKKASGRRPQGGDQDPLGRSCRFV